MNERIKIGEMYPPKISPLPEVFYFTRELIKYPACMKRLDKE